MNKYSIEGNPFIIRFKTALKTGKGNIGNLADVLKVIHL